MASFPLDLQLEAEGGLVLSRPVEADVTQVAEACSDPEIARFTQVPSPYTEADARHYVDLSAEGARGGSALNLLVRDRDGRVLASCGLPRVDHDHLVGEVGYWVARSARGLGVATRASRAVCRWGFDQLGLERLTLEAAASNPASNAVARRLGFTHEGTTRRALIDGEAGRPGQPRFDMHLWGLLPGELT